MELTRRDFVRAGLGACTVLGFSVYGARAGAVGVAKTKVAEVPVLWMATGSCSGCSVSLLNAGSPTVQELLLGEVLPGKHVSLAFHATVMAAQGDQAMGELWRVAREQKGKYVLVVDGATATLADGLYCEIGEREGRPVTGYSHVRDLGRDALAVLAVGTCASYGGIPAAPPNPTGAVEVKEIFRREKITTPLVNVPGCPPHPDWIIGTIATFLVGGLKALKLDQHGRPKAFYSTLIHDNCPFRGQFDKGEFAESFGDHGCLYKLGCKGPMTHADCPHRRWNNGTSWCIGAGHPCIGCVEPGFPFTSSLFDRVEPADLAMPSLYPDAQKKPEKRASADTYVALGLIGAGGVAAGAALATAVRRLKKEPDTGSDDAPAAPSSEPEREEKKDGAAR